MKHHYNKEELVELKRKYDMQVSKEALEEIKHSIDLIVENERLHTIIKEAIEYNNHLIEHAKYHLNIGHLKKMKKILQGSDKE